MELSGRTIVVTGGASGIGRALGRRFAAEGARGVVITDVNGEGAAALARELGEVAIAVGCDAAAGAQLDDLITRTEAAFGPIDVFCANAGIAEGTDLGTTEALWERVLDVNLRSHIRAAERLVPGWLERGEGYFLSTASAAGLLSQIGSAPYAVTKHGALAFAEWLAITYGDRGVRVSCLCPMGVNTGMMPPEALEHPDGLGARVVAAAGAILEPEDVADVVVEAMRDERFLVLPHPEVLEFFRRKAADYDRWLSGMRRLQASVQGTGG